jgi:hypothetical protein
MNYGWHSPNVQECVGICIEQVMDVLCYGWLLFLSMVHDLILDRDRITCFVRGNSFKAGWADWNWFGVGRVFSI